MLPGGVVQSALQPVVFGPDFAGVAQLALKTPALGEHGVKLELPGVQSAGQVGAYGVGVLLACEAPLWLWQLGEALAARVGW